MPSALLPQVTSSWASPCTRRVPTSRALPWKPPVTLVLPPERRTSDASAEAPESPMPPTPRPPQPPVTASSPPVTVMGPPSREDPPAPTALVILTPPPSRASREPPHTSTGPLAAPAPPPTAAPPPLACATTPPPATVTEPDPSEPSPPTAAPAPDEATSTRPVPSGAKLRWAPGATCRAACDSVPSAVELPDRTTVALAPARTSRSGPPGAVWTSRSSRRRAPDDTVTRCQAGALGSAWRTTTVAAPSRLTAAPCASKPSATPPESVMSPLSIQSSTAGSPDSGVTCARPSRSASRLDSRALGEGLGWSEGSAWALGAGAHVRDRTRTRAARTRAGSARTRSRTGLLLVTRPPVAPVSAVPHSLVLMRGSLLRPQGWGRPRRSRRGPPFHGPVRLRMGVGGLLGERCRPPRERQGPRTFLMLFFSSRFP